MTIIEKLTKNIIDKSIKVKESGTMCNIGFVSPAMKKLSSSEAQKRIEKYDDVYELFDDNTYKKCDIANFSHNKMYGVMYGDKFSFREHLVNEYRVTGRVLFCKGTDDVCIKIRLAYDAEPLKSVYAMHRNDFLVKSNEHWLKEHFSHTYPDTMFYLLIDGEFKGVAVGKFRYTIEIEDIQVDLPPEEAISRKEDILNAIRLMCGANTSILRYCGVMQS